MQDENNYKELEELAKNNDLEIFKISAVTGEGLNELFNYVAEIIKTLPKEDIVEPEERMIYTLEEEENPFTVIRNNNEFTVEGSAIDRLMARVNTEDNESFAYLQRMLKKLGIDDALKAKGVKEGDTVNILDWVFEWYD